MVRAMLLATENGSAGYRGFVSGPLEKYLTKHTNRKFLLMVCGPWAMLRATVELARRFRHSCLVSMERPHGGAGWGCAWAARSGSREPATKPISACAPKGPVFWAEKVVWDSEKTSGSGIKLGALKDRNIGVEESMSKKNMPGNPLPALRGGQGPIRKLTSARTQIQPGACTGVPPKD